VLFALRRLAITVPLLLVVSMLVFLVGELLPGDPAAERFDVHANPKAVAEWRARKGLDRPVAVRYLRYLTGHFGPPPLRDEPPGFLGRLVDRTVPGGVLRGEFGESYVDDRKVGPALADRFAATFELSLTALLIAIPVGLAAGVLSAAVRGRWIDYAANTTALFGISLPVFWLGMLLVLLARLAGWNHFQARYDVREFEDAVGAYSTKYYLFESILRGNGRIAWSCLQYLAIPAIALATIPMATIARMTRSSVLEEVGKDYVRTARAKGAGPLRAIVGHALRNALVPIVTVIGLQAGTLLAGAALTETVFSWPGLGTFIVEGVRRKDSPALTGGLLVVAATFIVVNLAVDLLYGVLDPRIRTQHA
jgi:ABC-type dipeptide/oligopeptide/nickel transport system permease component